jgi:hypothetical protein
MRQFGQSTKFQLDLMRFCDTLVFVLQDTGRDAGPNLSHQAARPITDNSAALPRVARAASSIDDSSSEVAGVDLA